MKGGEDKEGTSTGGIAPVVAIVVSVPSDVAGFSADVNGDSEVTTDGGRTVAASMREDKDKVCTEVGESKEQCRTIDLERIGGCDDKICRICHLGEEVIGSAVEGCYLIKIGCGCKGDLRIAHRRCTEAWCRVKGNRLSMQGLMWRRKKNQSQYKKFRSGCCSVRIGRCSAQKLRKELIF